MGYTISRKIYTCMCLKLFPSIHHMKTWVNIVVIRVYNLSIISWQKQTISGKYLHWHTKLKLQSKNRHLTLQQHVILTLNRSVLTISFMEAKYLRSIPELFYCISLILNWTKYFIRTKHGLPNNIFIKRILCVSAISS